MNNQEFVHFRWGVHEDQSKPMYALLDTAGSKFYLVDQDIELLKLTQLILLSSRHLLTAKISSIRNYEPAMIDNSVALSWGIKTPYGIPYTFSGGAGFWQIRNYDDLYNWCNPITDYDLNLQRNIFLVVSLLKKADDFIRIELNRLDDQNQNEQLIEFSKIVMPDDTDVIDLINVDLDSAEKLKNRIKDCKKTLIKLLASTTLTDDSSTVTTNIKNYFDQQENLSDIDDSFRTELVKVLTK